MENNFTPEFLKKLKEAGLYNDFKNEIAIVKYRPIIRRTRKPKMVIDPELKKMRNIIRFRS
jgi:hypothetical protein